MFLTVEDLVLLANGVRRFTGNHNKMTVAQMTQFLNEAEIDGGSFPDEPTGDIDGRGR